MSVPMQFAWLDAIPEEELIRAAMPRRRVDTVQTGLRVEFRSRLWLPYCFGTVYAYGPDGTKPGGKDRYRLDDIDVAGQPVLALFGGGSQEPSLVPPFDEGVPGSRPRLAIVHPRLVVELVLEGFFGRVLPFWLEFADGTCDRIGTGRRRESDVSIRLPYVSYLDVRSGTLSLRDAVDRTGALVGSAAGALAIGGYFAPDVAGPLSVPSKRLAELSALAAWLAAPERFVGQWAIGSERSWPGPSVPGSIGVVVAIECSDGWRFGASTYPAEACAPGGQLHPMQSRSFPTLEECLEMFDAEREPVALVEVALDGTRTIYGPLAPHWVPPTRLLNSSFFPVVDVDLRAGMSQSRER